jgi:hypothetical protein
MEKIKAIHFSYLRAEEHFEYVTKGKRPLPLISRDDPSLREGCRVKGYRVEGCAARLA